MFMKFHCGVCGHAHRLGHKPTAERVVVVCSNKECGARIDLTPGKWFKWSWPNVTSRPRAA